MAFQVRCESCSQVVNVEDVNLDRMLARCRHCNHLFDCSHQVGKGKEASAASPKPEVGQPQGVSRQQQGAKVVLSWGWFHPAVLFLTFFCIAWDSFLFFWYRVALSMPKAPWIMLVFPIGHVFVGVTLTYGVLCSFFNRTRVQFDRSQVEISHGPLPSPGHNQLCLDSADLDQVFVVEQRRSKGSRSYEVCALLKNGSRVKLLGSLQQLERALYLEQQLESYLGIRDRAVAGEFRHN